MLIPQPTKRHLVLVEIESRFPCDDKQIAQYVHDSLCKCEADRETVYTLPITHMPQGVTISVLERMLTK